MKNKPHVIPVDNVIIVKIIKKGVILSVILKKLFGLALMHEDTFRDFKNVQFDFIKVLSTAFNNINSF